MIVYEKDKSPTYFNNYGLTTIEISQLIETINLIINNHREEYYRTTNNKDYKNIETEKIFNTWLYYNPKWSKMDFSFLVDVFDYIDSLKDEDGIMLS